MSTVVRKIKNPKREKNSENPKKHTLDKEFSRIKIARFTFLFLGVVLVLGSLVLYREDEDHVAESTSVQSAGSMVTSFSQEPVRVDAKVFRNTSIRKQSLPPNRIVIPSLSIDLSVKQAKVVQGYWEVFPDVAGYGAGSGLPGEVGNQVIFAHARKGLFGRLSDIAFGAKIYIFTDSGWFGYAVDSKKQVLPTQKEVIAPTSEEVLTLYTCSGYADSKRFIVTAKRK